MIEKLREFHRRTGASHFASSASVLPVLLEVKSRMKPGDVCLLGKAHAISAFQLVFETNKTIYIKGEGAMPFSMPDTALAHSEFSSLGSALPFALGVAKMRPNITVFVVVGDGEMQEGSCWEAIGAAARLDIRNVEVHVDCNRMQAMGNCPPVGFIPIEYHRTHKGDSWECHYANA